MVFDKGKAPASTASDDATTVPVSQEVLMAILYRIDALTAQVSDLALAQAGNQNETPATAETEEKEDKVHDAEKSSIDDDDGDTVVVQAHSSVSACAQAHSRACADAGPSASADAADDTPHFLTCPNCQHRFPPPPPRKNWYVITRGRQVGIFTDWNVAASHVVGVKGAVFKRYGTRAEAEAAFNAALASCFVQVIT
ncbi:hypothetical protein C8J56DRAFT_1045448 [Mycena floridula]|nr:hypothetical protein C8J56DRAFT_1045448 [Mycena floridula]